MPSQSLLSNLAPLLFYPDDMLKDHIARLHQNMTIHHPESLPGLVAFSNAMLRESQNKREDIYTHTFDLAPSCAPYLSVHLFGEESFKRPQLMAGLKARYIEKGFNTGGELPDHVGIVLQFAPQFETDEWQDLCHHCLKPALIKMRDLLANSDNPYRHLFDITIAFIEAEELLEIVYA